MGKMNKDHYYAEMLNLMRSQGKIDNPTTLQLGEMQSSDSVLIDDLLLESDDLYIADYLAVSDGLKKGDIVAIQKLSDDDMYVILARVVGA